MTASALVLLAVLVVLAALAMGIGIAVRAARSLASPERIARLAADGVGGAPAAMRSMEESDRSGGVVQVVVPLAAVLVGWSGVVVARALLPEGARTVGAVVVAVLAGLVVAVLCDSLPRAAALSAPERVMVTLGWPYRVLAAVLGPFVTVSGWLASAVLLPVGMWLDGGRGRAHTADELAELVGDLGDGGSLDRAGRGLLAGALGFLDVRVGDVMAPREVLVTVPHTSTVAEAEELVHSSGHSRVLVVGASEEVTGFLHAKDLITLPPDQRDGFLPPGLVRIALRVEPRDRVDEVLLRMRRSRRHVAVVVEGDEVRGLVTLEDVLEAIVGDIRDESDVDDDAVVDGTVVDEEGMTG